MAVLKERPAPGLLSRTKQLFLRHGVLPAIRKLLSDPEFTILVGFAVIAADFVLSILVIRFVKYTEIDWSTYMEQVDKFLNGTRDYSQIYGTTGPLVYPAGHLYIFTCLRFLTHNGSNILMAQHLFLLIYTMNSILVVLMYNELRLVPPYVLVLMLLSSYRVHSIFLLRLFNDPIAVTIFHVSILCFIRRHWITGSFFYSMAVSVKMNILLFAPGLLLLLLENVTIVRTVVALTVCAAVQVLIGMPFLLHSPVNYVRGSFDLSRVFLYKWTVNWRFVPEPWFTSRPFHISLLISHVLVLMAMHRKRWYRAIRNVLQATGGSEGQKNPGLCVAKTLFSVNLIGILFSRSLHYQFYVWYFYSVPALLWSTPFPLAVRLVVPILLEFCWNTYPSTKLSSSVLLLIHFSLLIGVWITSSKDESSGEAQEHERKSL